MINEKLAYHSLFGVGGKGVPIKQFLVFITVCLLLVTLCWKSSFKIRTWQYEELLRKENIGWTRYKKEDGTPVFVYWYWKDWYKLCPECRNNWEDWCKVCPEYKVK